MGAAQTVHGGPAHAGDVASGLNEQARGDRSPEQEAKATGTKARATALDMLDAFEQLADEGEG
eukprot:gene2510-5507_t